MQKIYNLIEAKHQSVSKNSTSLKISDDYRLQKLQVRELWLTDLRLYIPKHQSKMI